MNNSGYRLVTLKNGITSLCENQNEETFHPCIGPQAEAEALYVGQLNIAARMAQCAGEFVVWDVGLGAGANALGAIRAVRECGGKLRLVSFDCTDAALRFALENAEALGYVCGFETTISSLLSDHRVTFYHGQSQIQWDFHLADFPAFLEKPASERGLPAPHAVMFDAYSPSKNPSMWTLPLFTKLFESLSPDRPCSLSTYSRSTMLRVSLMLAGFYAGCGEPTGQKDETTIAANRLDLIPRPLEKKWLERVKISTGAEPLHENVYRQSPIAPDSWEKLRLHPQWGRISSEK